MIVDKSHSKKDILYLFKKHGVNISETLTKGKIVQDIEKYINDFQYDDKINNCTELKDYLKNVSKKQRPTSHQKTTIMFNAKKIIKWAKNNYIFDMVIYRSKHDPYRDVMNIYMWGDLPSVRRACRFYNLSPYCTNNVNPVISEEVEEEMNQKKIIKQQSLYCLTIRRATKENPILVTFD